jgi:hypothetical protein
MASNFSIRQSKTAPYSPDEIFFLSGRTRHFTGLISILRVNQGLKIFPVDGNKKGIAYV